MKVPKNILSIINRINESEEKWKPLYMAVWQYAFQIKKQFENTPFWNKKINIRLPAFKKGYEIYIPNKLYTILTTKDVEFTIEHLIFLFSLFEDLLNETSKILCEKQLGRTLGKKIQTFFEQNKDIISDKEFKELNLAKETRNCYIHKRGKIDSKWINSYKETEGKTLISEGENLVKGFKNI